MSMFQQNYKYYIFYYCLLYCHCYGDKKLTLEAACYCVKVHPFVTTEMEKFNLVVITAFMRGWVVLFWSDIMFMNVTTCGKQRTHNSTNQ